ncbi:class IV adenylate cyclase [Photobacterium gaetbulicola]|uniref:Putative adenylyl cyclase CyaB n=1 Tax=Photobacterium gaetbulicola Gung47 TaxID=658445 RepID=A0A0C5X1N9_9GAMM|nr:class IV adenylate cyclase [Photobacterium gaetbulicola]AJR09230.1 putative adenylyl cyclase CyaB [Photobacterium gaetbulicola Gung47]PSU11723.1 class IV adenylate cyclase [Photobacterium gaetbulicola]
MSSEHFKGKYEVELKYRVESKSDFLQVLSSLHHEVMLVDNIETDWYFDTPEHSLASQNKTVAIREMEPSDIKLWIVKGPEADRCEATNITDAKAAKSMLATMGYEPYLLMKKVRSIYFVGPYHITLDFLDGIGHFAEFAIMTNDESLLAKYKGELEQLAKQFGLTSKDLEHRSYRTLYQLRSTL